MALDDFKSEQKTSSPKKSTEGPSEGGVDEFIKNSQKETQEVAGGFEISNDNTPGYETEVIKIFGGPGTGKTTTMVGNTDIEDFQGILHYMFENYNPKELMLIAYTRAAADEAKERLVNLTSHSENKLGKRITTIHSLAMQKQGLRPKDIVEIRYVPDKYNFCRKVGLQYAKNESSDPSEMMAEPTDEGHLFFDMLSWLKSSLKPLDEAVDCPLFSEWTYTVEEFEEWGQKWDAYKKEKGIWEFDDAILECVNEEVKVDAKYLFVDEVQDLYPLQQAFLDNQFGHVKRIFLAGDDDQTIYEWAGAKPEYFLNMEGKVTDEMPELWSDKTGYWDNDGVYILDQSWRMPNEILRLAKMCIEQVDERQEKRIKPHHEGGTFIPLRSPSADTVLKYVDFDDTYMLFRAKYQINNFSKKLINEGIPYVDTRFVNTNYGGTWNSDMIKLRDGLRAIMRREDTMTGNQASRIIEEMPENALKDNRKTLMTTLGSRTDVPTQSVVDVISYGWPSGTNGILTYCMEFEEANYYQEEAVRNNLKNGHEEMYPEGFKLGTIHSSKGREAGTIVLSLDSADPIMENMPPGGINDAERRLMYVGMTRTKDTLVMVEDLDAESPSFTIDEVLGPQWRDDYEFKRPELEEGALADD